MATTAVPVDEHAAHHEHELSFLRKYIFSTDHKIIGIQFLLLSLLGLLFGGVLALAIWPGLAVPLDAQVPSDAYRVETVATPKGIAPEVSAVCFGADGRLYATFRRGYIYSLDTKTGRWRRFAVRIRRLTIMR